MKQRCNNPKNPDYENWGGRGIRVCERWQTFENFLADMGPKPAGYSIERINVDGNYEPGNCRWIPRSEEQKNQRRSGTPATAARLAKLQAGRQAWHRKTKETV